MSLPKCPECGAIPETVKVGPEGYASYFVMCQAERHRRRKDNGVLTPYGLMLSDGLESAAKAEAQWEDADRRRRQRESEAR